MLRLLGSQRRLCDGVTRRDLLHIGGLGLYGLTAERTASLAAESLASGGELRGFGKAKRCIMLFLFGAAPQHETFDPKPDAPVEIQGEMKAIQSALSGVPICEGLPLTAQVADRLTIVRSMTHPYPLHCVAYALSGMPTYTYASTAQSAMRAICGAGSAEACLHQPGPLDSCPTLYYPARLRDNTILLGSYGRRVGITKWPVGIIRPCGITKVYHISVMLNAYFAPIFSRPQVEV